MQSPTRDDRSSLPRLRGEAGWMICKPLLSIGWQWPLLAVAAMSIGGLKTPKRARPSSQTHDSDDDDRPVRMLVCINLEETDEACLMRINNYMKEAIADTPSIRSFACQSDLQHPQEKSVFFEVPLEQIAWALMPHLQQMSGRIEREVPIPPFCKHDLFSGTPITPDNIASFCRVIGYAHHNYGIPCFPASIEEFQNAYEHSLVFRRQFLQILMSNGNSGDP